MLNSSSIHFANDMPVKKTSQQYCQDEYSGEPRCREICPQCEQFQKEFNEQTEYEERDADFEKYDPEEDEFEN